MTFVYDESTDSSDLVILHAQDFTGDPVATVHLPAARALRLPRQLGPRPGLTEQTLGVDHPEISRRVDRQI